MKNLNEKETIELNNQDYDRIEELERQIRKNRSEINQINRRIKDRTRKHLS
jgi:hypothetical protein